MQQAMGSDPNDRRPASDSKPSGALTQTHSEADHLWGRQDASQPIRRILQRREPLID
jgi:hypothetical protein